MNDLTTMTNDGNYWTEVDRQRLESELLLATSPPLCLDPSPAVFYTQLKQQQEKHAVNTPAINR